MLRNSRLFVGAAVAVACLLLTAVRTAHPAVYYHPGSTRKVMQLTGDWDGPFGTPTRSRTQTHAAMVATDLGSSFEHEGSLCFLFGDTFGRTGDYDTLGFTSSTDPWLLQMQVPLAPDGKWRQILPPGLSYGGFCVPSHGISIDGTIYVVYTQNGSNGAFMKRSFLISTADRGATWHKLFQLDNNTEASPRFVNVWMEERDGYVYIFGSGQYRASSPTLARVERSKITQKSAWEYYAGTSGGNPVWSPAVTSAAFLFTHNQVGEFSCSWIETLGCWVMLYKAWTPRGILMRTAPQPWGPWSAAQVVFDPALTADQAFGTYMHLNWNSERRDRFSDPGREFESGDEYAPYLIPRFTQGTSQRTELFYTLSTWNPSQVVLMRSVVGTAPAPAQRPAVTQTLTHREWIRYPANVANEFARSGRNHITTFGALGDATMGWMWQRLPAGATHAEFFVHGGHGEIFLLEGGADLPASGNASTVAQQLRNGAYGRVALRATGVDDNTRDISWKWDLRKFASPLKIVVLDALNEPWGFVSLSELQLRVETNATDSNLWMLYE